MKKYILFLLILTSACLQAQIIFQEDFDNVGGPTFGGAGTYSFPAGWLKANVDNLTPAGSVSYVNEAWERREDFSFNVADSCAFSTSWYTPAGTANDWMWTPAIAIQDNCILKWNAVTYDPLYPDGYEVRIMVAPDVPTGGTGSIGNMITASTVLFSTGAENTSWTSRSVSLSAYDGETVYIGFRNNSSDKFLLLIDDVQVERLVNYDAELLTTDMNEYSQVPENQEREYTFDADVMNSGLQAITNVTLEVDVYDETNTIVYSTNSAAFASLAAGNQTNLVTTGSFTGNAAGLYRVHYDITTTEMDDEPDNDTLSRYITISETVYARDEGAQTGQLGIGAGNGGYLGQEFEITAESMLSSISIFSGSLAGDFEMGAAIFRVTGGTPEDIPLVVATPLVIPGNVAPAWYEFDIPDQMLVAGDVILVAAQEIDSTLSVGQTASIFTPGTEWVNWPTNPFGGWANIEDFGASFGKPFMIRANLVVGTSTCEDGILNGDEEGVDCGGSCGPCPPPTAVCGVITVYVDPLNPVYDGPGTSNIWYIPYQDLDAGSSSSYPNPNLDVRRHLSTLTFDWTTNGACIDATPNGGALSNADKGTAYRDCLPVRNADFNLWKLYQLRIQDPAGSGQCIGIIKVIPQAPVFSVPVIHYVIPDYTPYSVDADAYQEDALPIADFLISPNPGNALLQAEWSAAQETEVSIKIFDGAGNLVVSQDFNSLQGYNASLFDMSHYAPGMYFVFLQSPQAFSVAKWIKAN